VDALESSFNLSAEDKPRRVIISPGIYPVELKYQNYAPIIIEGLYDNPWSEKEDQEKTILTQPSGQDRPLFITYSDTILKVILMFQ